MIDYSSFDNDDFPIINTTTSNNNVNNNQYYTQYEYITPIAGVYLVSFSQRMRNGENNNDFRICIAKNRSTIVKEVQVTGSSWVNWISGTITAVVKADKDDRIECQSRGGGTQSYTTGAGVVTIARIR